ncbi:GspH/FimT family protein [Thermus amyloliquefaciens]|uniref:GspH/FimT family protein n=1 Tax=Thermus amyloliquefaciens TaxID=1449080 RepID=UPI0005713EA4|nr:GspH/FimT family protein [Thermus amyloliquefaciens]
MRWRQGLSLIELILLLAVLGVALTLSAGLLNPSRQAVNQAAQSLAAQVTRARLEAIRRNEFVGLRFSAQGAGQYEVFVDTNRDGAPDAVLQTVAFGQGDWGRVRLTQVQGANPFLFDTRGIPKEFAETAVTLSDRQGTYSKTVRISPQGRAEVR